MKNKKDFKRKERKNIQISLRISKENSEMLKKDNSSPQKVFDWALVEYKKLK